MRARSVLFLAALSLVTGSVRALAVLIVPEDLNPGNSEVNASIDLSTSCYYLGAAVSGCSAAAAGETNPEAKVVDGASMADAEVNISDDPSVNIQVNLDPANNTVGQAIATLTYQFGVNGPSGQPVNVYVIGAISITDVHASGPITAGSVYYTLVGPGVNGYNGEFINPSAGVQHIFDKYTILGGNTYTVTLSTGVDLNEGIPTCCEAMPGQIATVTANFDPTVTIDPNSQNASAFSLVFSPGFGPGSTVPEPSTWTLMLLGFVGLGFAGYRASRRTVMDP